MELKEILAFLQKNIKLIALSTITGAIFGIGTFYLLPTKYYASGSLFIRRSIYPYSEDHFTYEGYYSQQAAMFYANSVVGLIESEDVLSQALKKLNIEVNEKTLVKYSRRIRTIKAGPQLVGIVVKGKTENDVKDLWQAVSDETIEKLGEVNKRGDPFVSVAKVLETPILKKDYRNIYIYIVIGFGLGFVLSTFSLALKKYLSK